MSDQILPIDGVSETRKKKNWPDFNALITAMRENIPIEKISIVLWGKPIGDAICKNFERMREEKREWNIQDRAKESISKMVKIFFKGFSG